MNEKTEPVLIAGEWRESRGTQAFHAVNPANKQIVPGNYPVSPMLEVEEALAAATRAWYEMEKMPAQTIAEFLERYAERIEERSDEITGTAALETGLPREPRLNSIELPRTTAQLRQAAQAARERSWALPTIDSKNNVRSMYRSIGPVAVFGPNNFPFAFGSVSGGDFAAAIAAGNPVIAKAHTGHPGATRILAEEAFKAVQESGMPPAAVQLIYRISHEDGKRLVSHPLIGATGYTGSRKAGLELKRAADQAGKPIYLELSSINPVVILPGALEERMDAIVEEYVSSLLLGAGQFCTNPGLVLLVESDASHSFVEKVREAVDAAPVGTLLGEKVEHGLLESIASLIHAGAELLTGGERGPGSGYSCRNTLLKVPGRKFLAEPLRLQQEAFGNAGIILMAESLEQLCDILRVLEGNLTGCIYSDTAGRDDRTYDMVAELLSPRVGRLLNDKMPTGVLVSPAMNHGGPFPATGHPGFTAVGIPASLRRFARLQCYDNVREERLPVELRGPNPTGRTWRYVDGNWTLADLDASE